MVLITDEFTHEFLHFAAGGIRTHSVVLEAQTTSWWAAPHHNIAQCAY